MVAWLYAGDLARLGAGNRARLERRALVISPMVELELQHLFEIGRTAVPGREVVDDLGRRLGLKHCDRPFAQVVAVSAGETWTRDPFDRLIVAQAALYGTPLRTQDRQIRQYYPGAVWEE